LKPYRLGPAAPKCGFLGCGQGRFVGHIVGAPRKGVDRRHMGAQPGGNQGGGDREILVVAAGQIEALPVLQIECGFHGGIVAVGPDEGKVDTLRDILIAALRSIAA